MSNFIETLIWSPPVLADFPHNTYLGFTLCKRLALLWLTSWQLSMYHCIFAVHISEKELDAENTLKTYLKKICCSSILKSKMLKARIMKFFQNQGKKEIKQVEKRYFTCFQRHLFIVYSLNLETFSEFHYSDYRFQWCSKFIFCILSIYSVSCGTCKCVWEVRYFFPHPT